MPSRGRGNKANRALRIPVCDVPIDLKVSRRVGIGDWLLGLHIDHLIPIAKGGPDTLDNVRPAHALCNLKKGSKLAG
jgi:5-methylcytosine-specific restriction endonuclease McrA